jgi:hypothetical protein
MKHVLSFTLTLLLAISVLFSMPARAQNSCVPYLECQPLVTKAVHGTVGTHLFWFVRNPAGGIDHHGFSCLPAACDLQKLMAVSNQVLTGKLTPAAAWTEHMGFACDYSVWEPIEGEAPICRERKVALLTQRDVWLEGVKRQLDWKVKPLAGSNTRPLYRVTNGVMSTTVVARVSVGEVCDLSKPSIASGADRFMSVTKLGLLPFVALCELEQS